MRCFHRAQRSQPDLVDHAIPAELHPTIPVIGRHVVRTETVTMSPLRVVACSIVFATACGGGGGGSSATDAARGDDDVDAAQPDAPPDALPGPCTLPPLSLTVATVSGCADAGISDGPRETARFSNPVNVVLASDGTVYVADFDTNRVRKVDPSGNTTTLVLGTTFHRPFGLALASDDVLYVETDDDDLGMHTSTTGTIWRVMTATGVATVVARDLGRPRGLAVLGDGRIAMADQLHHVVSTLDPIGGGVTILAGATDSPGHVNANGSFARLSQPYDVVLLPDGDLAVADLGNHQIRRVTLAGDATDLAGSGTSGDDDGTVAAATFQSPKGLAVTPAGAIYVSDVDNHDLRVIDAGQVTRIAGTGVAGWLDHDDMLASQFYGLEGIDTDGTMIVVADGNGGDGNSYNHIRVIHLPATPRR
jgi:DNA-binding beta-propeller fold protein YncE